MWVLVLRGDTQQVNGSVGELDLQLELARSNSVSWLPGSLGSTWRVTIGRQKRPFENALDEANELRQVQVQQGVGTAAVGTAAVGTASVGTASVGNVFEQSKCMVSLLIGHRFASSRKRNNSFCFSKQSENISLGIKL